MVNQNQNDNNANVKRVTILARQERAEQIEEVLKQVELIGLFITKARGYGGQPNFYASDWSVESVLIEVFLPAENLQQLKQRIKTLCRVDEDGAGLMIISEVTELQALNRL